MYRAFVQVGGLLNLAFAAFHLSFPWLFGWAADLGAISAVNRATVYTLHAAVILVLLAFAYLSLFLWGELLATRLGRAVLLIIALVWLLRGAAEVAFYRIGGEGAWWRLAVFLALAGLYVIPLIGVRMHTESSALRSSPLGGHSAAACAVWILLALAALLPAVLVLGGSFPIFTVVWLIVPLIALVRSRDAGRVGFRSVGWRELARTSAITFAGLLLLAGLFEPWSHAYGLLVGEVLTNPRPDTTFAWLIRYDGLTAWAGLALYSGLVTIFAEELFFRGWLLQLLQRRMRPAWAIMLQATAFMLPNMIAALLLPPLSGLVYAGVYTWLGVGVIGGWAAWRTQSIWPSLVAATLWNLALTALVL